MMKGLFYREIYLARKSYITGIILFFVIEFMGILVRLSTLYGNIANLDEESFYITDVYTYNIFMYLPAIVAFICFMNDGEVIISDFKCRWNIFSYTIPLSEKKIAGVKYIILTVSMICAFVFGIINALIICKISGKEFTSGIIKALIIFMALFSVHASLSIPLLIKFKSKVTVDMIFTAVFTAIVFICKSKIKEFSEKIMVLEENNSEDKLIEIIIDTITSLRDKFFTVSPFVIISVLTAGYFLTVAMLKGREK